MDRALSVLFQTDLVQLRRSGPQGAGRHGRGERSDGVGPSRELDLLLSGLPRISRAGRGSTQGTDRFAGQLR